MNHYAMDQLVQDRIADRHRAAARRRLVRAMRRRRRPSSAPPQPTGDLGVDLASLGVGACETDITRFARHARSAGASDTLLDVLADRGAPVVARQRAFARIAASLEHGAQRSHAEASARRAV